MVAVAVGGCGVAVATGVALTTATSAAVGGSCAAPVLRPIASTATSINIGNISKCFIRLFTLSNQCQ